MSKKNWTFTTYENGKPVATESDVDHAGAIARVRAAMAGDEQVLSDLMTESRIERPGPELIREVFLAHAA